MYFVKIAQCRKNKGDFGYIAKNITHFDRNLKERQVPRRFNETKR